MKGIILLNIGTPSECTKPAVEKFIGDMLSDPLVLENNRTSICFEIFRKIFIDLEKRRTCYFSNSIFYERTRCKIGSSKKRSS